jgi:hypothetical protein
MPSTSGDGMSDRAARLTARQIRGLEAWLRGDKKAGRVRTTAYHLMGRRARLPSPEEAIGWSVREAAVLERASVHRRAGELGAPPARKESIHLFGRVPVAQPAAVLEDLAIRALEAMGPRRRAECIEECATRDWPDVASTRLKISATEVMDPIGLAVLEKVPANPDRPTTRRAVVAQAKRGRRREVGRWLDVLERKGLVRSKRPPGAEPKERDRREDLLFRTAKGNRALGP